MSTNGTNTTDATTTTNTTIISPISTSATSGDESFTEEVWFKAVVVVGCLIFLLIIVAVIVLIRYRNGHCRCKRKKMPPPLPHPYQIRFKTRGDSVSSRFTIGPGSPPAEIAPSKPPGLDNLVFSDDESHLTQRQASTSSAIYANEPSSPIVVTASQNSNGGLAKNNDTDLTGGIKQEGFDSQLYLDPTITAHPMQQSKSKPAQGLIPKARSDTHVNVEIRPDFPWKQQRPIIHSPPPEDDTYFHMGNTSTKRRSMIPSPKEINFSRTKSVDKNESVGLKKSPPPCPGTILRDYVNLRKDGSHPAQEDGHLENYVNVKQYGNWGETTAPSYNHNDESNENMVTAENVTPFSNFAHAHSNKYSDWGQTQPDSLTVSPTNEASSKDLQDYSQSTNASAESEKEVQNPLNYVNITDYIKTPPHETTYYQNNAAISEASLSGQPSTKPKSPEPPVTFPKPKVKHSNTAPTGPPKNLSKWRDLSQQDYTSKENSVSQNSSDFAKHRAQFHEPIAKAQSSDSFADTADEDDDVYENTSESLLNNSYSSMSNIIQSNSSNASNFGTNGIKSKMPPSTLPKTQKKSVFDSTNEAAPVDIADLKSRLKKTNNKIMED